MRTLIRFIREAWPLVRRRRDMSAEAYERAKAVLLAKYTLEQKVCGLDLQAALDRNKRRQIERGRITE